MQIRKEEAKSRMSGLGVKALLWFLALMIIGTIVCVILSVMKVAIQAIMTVATVLAVLVVVGVAAYYAIRYKYHADRYKRALEQERQN